MSTRDIVVIMLAATVCFILVCCIVAAFFQTLPIYVADAISQTLSVMVGGVVGYAAAKGDSSP